MEPERRPLPRDTAMFTRYDNRPMAKRRHPKPLVSFAHLMVLIGVLMFLGFAWAVMDSLGYLPGSIGAGRRLGFGGDFSSISDEAQALIMFYLLGAPVLYVLQRFVFWRRTNIVGRNLAHAGIGVWSGTMLVLLATLA